MLNAIVRKTDRAVVWVNGAGCGFMNRRQDLFDTIPIPEQDVSDLFTEDDDGGYSIKKFVWPGILQVYPVDGRGYVIDRDTGKAINKAVHPRCGDTETLGIIRDQMVMWGNKLGLEFTADFTRLNKIAIAEIEKGVVQKAAITDA